MIYIITYEINDTVYDYTELFNAIKSIGKYQHPMPNIWFVSSSNTSPDEIASLLRSNFQSSHDHLYVMEVNSDSKRQGWLPRSFWAWLKNV